MRYWVIGALLFAGVARAEEKVVDCVDVGKVWTGHSVGFALLTHGKRQYAGYYDEQRRFIVAMREIPSGNWVKQDLGSKLGWDSHNYITMAMDDSGRLHVCGNMHAGPLVYFRTDASGDVTMLSRVEKMVGKDEAKCTYPRFMRGPSNEFIFTYRSGHSGNGDQIYNVWDGSQWKRMLDKPLTDGQGKMNAYMDGPTRGPDGYFHLCWVWRDNGGCETNHTLSYARSKDLRHWEKADGAKLELPLTLGNADVIDPVPAKGGIINGNTRLGFDSKKRVIVSYHKFDENGKTQAYNARFEEGKWKIYQTSEWDYRWYFSGGGSIGFEIHIGPVHAEKDGSLSESFDHVKYGSHIWKLDEATLKPIGMIEPKRDHAAELDKVESSFPGMSVRWGGDLGSSGKPGVRYALRWETLGVNRDKPREGPVPEGSMLRVYEFSSLGR
jgi:hypothetical protein